MADAVGAASDHAQALGGIVSIAAHHDLANSPAVRPDLEGDEGASQQAKDPAKEDASDKEPIFFGFAERMQDPLQAIPE